MAELQVRWHQATREIPEDQWQALVGGTGEAAAEVVTEAVDRPFYGWRWLHHLEASGSIVPRQGWQACNLGSGATIGWWPWPPCT